MATAKAIRIAVSRRALIKGGLAVGAGLVVGFQLPLTGRHAAMAQSADFAPNQWISIDRDGRVMRRRRESDEEPVPAEGAA